MVLTEKVVCSRALNTGTVCDIRSEESELLVDDTVAERSLVEHTIGC